MINRTYIVSLPAAQRVAAAFVDICVQATMGTRLLPVANPATYGAANVTTPPTGWTAVCGDAAYYELRGRTLPFEHLFAAGAAGGFTQKCNLGFKLVVTPYGDWHTLLGFSPPSAQLSQSLLSAVGGDAGGAVPATNLADPVYGVAQPVVRVYAPQDVEPAPATGLLMVVHLEVNERQEEDFSPVGGP